jgi:hypothetical protein
VTVSVDPSSFQMALGDEAVMTCHVDDASRLRRRRRHSAFNVMPGAIHTKAGSNTIMAPCEPLFSALTSTSADQAWPDAASNTASAAPVIEVFTFNLLIVAIGQCAAWALACVPSPAR